MRLTAAKCRTEQARQLDLSVSEQLANRRRIAVKAAAAWGEEALRAEEREAVKSTPLSKEDTEFARQFADEANDESAKKC